MDVSDLIARIEKASSDNQSTRELLSGVRDKFVDTTMAGIQGGAIGFGGGLWYAAIYENKPTKTGQARLGKRVPKSINKYGWNRSFHIDFDPKVGQHFNADFGPLKRFNHAPIPKWMNKLGRTSTLKNVGRGALVLGVGLSFYDIATAAPEDRDRAIGSAVGGAVGGAIGATVGSFILGPGVGTAIGGFVGGSLGSIGGEWLGEKFL